MNRLSDMTYQDYYNELFNELKMKIASESDDYVITQPTDDLVKYYYSKSSLNPIQFNTEKEESIEHIKYIKTIPAHQRDWGYQGEGDLQLECEKIVVNLPIVLNYNIDTILNLRTQFISISGGPQFSIDRNSIIIEIEIKGYGINLTDEQISDYISKTRSSVESFLSGKNAEIKKENERLKASLINFINERKQKLDSDKSRLNNLVNLIKIPLVRKASDLVKKYR